MAPEQPRVPRPGQTPGAKLREKDAVKGFKSSDFDTIYPEGETIEIPDDDQAVYIVKTGSVSAEMIIATQRGLKTYDLDSIEAGEYFNVHSFFGFKLSDGPNLCYRAQCRTVVMRVTPEMLPQDPKKLNTVFRSFMQTAARREGKLRMLTSYTLQRAEEKHADHEAQSQTIEGLRSANKQLEDRALELEKKLAKALEQNIELANANAAIRRNLKHANEENAGLKESTRFEISARQALEKKNAELTKQVAAQSSAISSAKFPSAAHLLESSGLEELEQNAKRFRAAADHFEDLATKMHRAMELLAEDNPGMAISQDVMMLMTGQEPPPRMSVQEAKAHRDSGSFKTVHLGSQSPDESARTQQRSKNMRDSDRIDTAQETPFAKNGPTAMSSTELSKRHPTDRQIMSPEANQGTIQASSKPKPPKHNLDDILQEFNQSVPDSASKTPRVTAPPRPGLSVPHPDFGPPSSETRPFLPDESHPALNSDVKLPPDPQAAQVSQSAEPKAPPTGVPTNISQRNLHPIDRGPGGFSENEADSDITPVVPYSHDDPPRQAENSSPYGFRDKSDIQELVEDWQRGSQDKMSAVDPQEPGDIPSPPSSLRDYEDEEEASPDDLQSTGEIEDELQELPMTTALYRSPGEVISDQNPGKPIVEDVRKTRGYEFPAPGKPPRPKKQ